MAECELAGREVAAYLPNPGRLRELLLPGAEVRLQPMQGGKLQWLAAAVMRERMPVVLDTRRANRTARRLIEAGHVPGLEGAVVLGQEVACGRHRFDLLLQHEGREVMLEVKSCTLAGRRVAAFPDAVTLRGRRHLQALAGLERAAVLFLVQHPGAELFVPDLHTDLELSRTLCEVRHRVAVIPAAISYGPELQEPEGARLLPVPWERVQSEARDRGCYLLVLALRQEREIEVGRLGRLAFPRGFYVYVGSARQGLSARLARHRRLRKRLHWHVDFLRREAEVVEALPFRTADDLECRLASAMEALGAWSVPGFGCSDCGCRSHLFGFLEDPTRRRDFQEMLLYWRYDRLGGDRDPRGKSAECPTTSPSSAPDRAATWPPSGPPSSG